MIFEVITFVAECHWSSYFSFWIAIIVECSQVEGNGHFVSLVYSSFCGFVHWGLVAYAFCIFHPFVCSVTPYVMWPCIQIHLLFHDFFLLLSIFNEAFLPFSFLSLQSSPSTNLLRFSFHFSFLSLSNEASPSSLSKLYHLLTIMGLWMTENYVQEGWGFDENYRVDLVLGSMEKSMGSGLYDWIGTRSLWLEVWFRRWKRATIYAKFWCLSGWGIPSFQIWSSSKFFESFSLSQWNEFPPLSSSKFHHQISLQRILIQFCFGC